MERQEAASNSNALGQRRGLSMPEKRLEKQGHEPPEMYSLGRLHGV